jgi:hypothetical protein
MTVRHMRRIGLLVAAVFFCIATLAQLPANALAGWLNRACATRCTLASVEGSLWQGQGLLLHPSPSGSQTTSVVHWSWSAPAQWRITDSHGGRILLRLAADGLETEFHHAYLPVASLGAWLPPTIGKTALGGHLTLDGGLRCPYGQSACLGKLGVNAQQISSNAIADIPLGDYRVELELGSSSNANLTPRHGPLWLTGKATLDAGNRWHYNGEVWTDPPHPLLDNYLKQLGPRDQRGRIALSGRY